MDVTGKRYIVGIDLGTTNSAVSYIDLTTDADTKGPTVGRSRLFSVDQLTDSGEVTASPMLPSFLYIPGAFDISEAAISLPWKTRETWFSGVFAREQGGKVPSRLVASAKSWLCHDKADRQAPILPWGSPAEIQKVSPVTATAAYLEHIRKAWNYRHADPDLALENQFVTLTVPASFDEVARDLTLEAARLAGFPKVLLLEEPLAAFYSWLDRHADTWMETVTPGELILVCDVGGGTTDFTLIALRKTDGSARFERLAVGDHLILGGDNVDLALARTLEPRLTPSATLTADQWKTLCHQCRRAKERILSGVSDAERITIMGKGAGLIAGTLTGTLTRDMVEQVILDGFYPIIDAGEGAAAATVRKGISEFGLPYETDPAITRHLGRFLSRHEKTVTAFLGKPAIPDHILFNGGSLKPEIIRKQILSAVCRWCHVDDPSTVRELPNAEPDLSVALGASYYGRVKAGLGVRVGSGSPRSYYIGVDTGENGHAAQALCLVERGLDEGSRAELSGQAFCVRTNQPVVFPLYSSSYRTGDRCGDLLDVDDTFTEMPPLQTVVQFGKKGEQRDLPVRLEADYTEVGTLSLWCGSQSTPHRWQLQFQLRRQADQGAVQDAEVMEASVVAAACDTLTEAFSLKAGPQAKAQLYGLSKAVCEILEKGRNQWPLSVIRQMADTLLTLSDVRSISVDHEIRWMNLLGFVMRPGFGDGFDENRVKQVWRLYKNGPVYTKNPQVRCEWWILWRRVAGGLRPGQQRQILQDLTPRVMPKKGGKVRLTPAEHREIWMLIANLEHLITKDKLKCGEAIFNYLKTNKKPAPQYVWALSRIGAREMLYASVDRVLPPQNTAPWIRGLMALKSVDAKPLSSALLSMGRLTGDRIRDLAPDLREEMRACLNRLPVSVASDCLDEVMPLVPEAASDAFGEALPAGLVLKTDAADNGHETRT